MVSALDRKMLRDLRRIWAQALAIALVMACGVATLVLAMGAYRSLDETKTAFYERYRFGEVFASATRVPKSVQQQLSGIIGVARLDTRIVQPILLDIIGMPEPASALVISLPTNNDEQVNRLYLRQGRLPESGRVNEVAVIENFAEAHGYVPGDQFGAIINGSKRTLTITGIVLTPEHIYSVGPGDMVPDNRRFGIIFMPEDVLANFFDMNGAFNNLSATLQRNADIEYVIEQIDAYLKRYGGAGAYDRDDQFSNAFIEAELDQLKAMASVMPPVFLFVSAFLVNMILSRLIALEREQIGLLKAIGYGRLAIASHYSKLVILIALVGLVIGSIFGFWLGQGLTRLYGGFFSFPFLVFVKSIDLYVIAAGVTVAAALLGAGKSIWSVTTLPPAIAMRPPAPEHYKSWNDSWLNPARYLSQLTTMAFRHLLRKPVRFVMTAFGTSLSVALLITALFSYDSIDHMIDVVFFQSNRQDVSVSFAFDRSRDTQFLVANLPGVLRAEPYRNVPAKIRNGHKELTISISGQLPESDISRVLDQDLEPVSLPRNGLLLSDRVALKLGVQPGDIVDVELTSKDGRVEQVPIVAKVQSFVGLTSFMSIDALNSLLRDGDLASGFHIKIDENRLLDLYEDIKQTPIISSVSLQNVSRQKFRDTIEENITTMTSIYVILAVIITFGVIYNSARIQLSERARELASLRVFGFTKAEVSSVLLIELAAIVILAQPLGWLIGFLFSWSVARGFESDLFRIPLIINSQTYAWSSIVVVIAAIFSALIVRRRVDRFDLISVLKTRE